MNLYDQILIDYYKNPRNKRETSHSDIKTEEYNPSCGDKVQFFINMGNNKITEITFLGFGCVISQATASMLTEFVNGKSIEDILNLQSHDILNLIKIELGPTRLKCAMLPLEAIQKGIQNFKDSLAEQN